MEQGLLISCLNASSVIQAIRIAHEIGYRNVEISVCPEDRRPNLADLSAKDRKEVRQLVDGLGLRISSVQCHIHNGYGDKDPGVRQRSVDHTLRMLDVAAAMGVDILHTVSGIAQDEAPHAEKVDRVADCYRKIFAGAGSGAPRIGLEPVFIYVIGNLAHTRALYQRLGDLPLEINFDPSHFVFHEESPVPFIQTYGSRFIHAHSKDARLDPLKPGDLVSEEDHLFLMPDRKRVFSFTAPGQGVLAWDEIIATMKAAGFDGVLSLEMGHGFKGDPREIAASTYRFFNSRYGLI